MSALSLSSNSRTISQSRDSQLQEFARLPALRLLPVHRNTRPMRIAVVGNHLPRQCGIATFTTDLCDAITAEYGAEGLQVVAVNDSQSSYLYPARVRNQIAEGDLSSYRSAAKSINVGNIDLVCLQHEYGIFGGKRHCS